jgi:hypothetical protein
MTIAEMLPAGSESSNAPAPARPVSDPLGATPEPPGFTRRTRLALDPRIRTKLDRLEALAAAARSEVFRIGDLFDAERQHLQELVGTERTWQANYSHHVTAAMRDQLHADQAANEAEQQRLASQRDAAQARWQQLARVAEAARAFLRLPATDRRRG